MNKRDDWSWHVVQDWDDDMINKMNIRWYDLIWYDMSYKKEEIYIWYDIYMIDKKDDHDMIELHARWERWMIMICFA